jgi:hypothetical protein
LTGLAIENIGIFFDHLVYFTAIGNIYGYLLWSFGIYFPVLGILFEEKSGNTGVKALRSMPGKLDVDRSTKNLTADQGDRMRL